MLCCVHAQTCYEISYVYEFCRGDQDLSESVKKKTGLKTNFKGSKLVKALIWHEIIDLFLLTPCEGNRIVGVKIILLGEGGRGPLGASPPAQKVSFNCLE